jgi:hypothetical protein
MGIYAAAKLSLLSHDLVLLDTKRLDFEGDYQDRAKAEASVVIIL